jgi:hypothetical protein
MNSLGHLLASFLKSALRIAGCITSLCFRSFVYIAVFFTVAELLGIVEEIVDKR